MSLINDALKRAKAAHEQAAAQDAPGPQLRPAEPARAAGASRGLLLPGALLILAIAALLLVWVVFRKATPEGAPPGATAHSIAGSTPAQPQLAAPPAPVASAPTPISAPAAARLAAAPAPGSFVPQVASPTQTTAVQTQEAPPAKPADALADVPPPKPAPLRLQAVIFHPTRPSVIISGKTVFIGDKLGEFRVMAINRESATLVGDGRTNVLTLAE